MTATLWITAACAAFSAFLALVVLGALRELSIARTEVDALMRVLAAPSPPSFLQQRLPGSLRGRLSSAVASGASRHVLLALSESCGGCTTLLRSLEERIADLPSLADSVSCVLAVSTPQSPLVALARRSSNNVIVDTDRSIFDQLEIGATPSMFAIALPDSTVVGHKVGPDLTWLEQALHQGTPEHAAA